MTEIVATNIVATRPPNVHHLCQYQPCSAQDTSLPPATLHCLHCYHFLSKHFLDPCNFTGLGQSKLKNSYYKYGRCAHFLLKKNYLIQARILVKKERRRKIKKLPNQRCRGHSLTACPAAPTAKSEIIQVTRLSEQLFLYRFFEHSFWEKRARQIYKTEKFNVDVVSSHRLTACAKMTKPSCG